MTSARPIARSGFRSLLLALCWLTVCCCPALALDPSRPLDHYGQDSWLEELPQASILSIAQTPDGYIWFTCFEGLVRFNGVEFTVFDKNNTPAITTNQVNWMHVDRDGTLWIGTWGGGLVRYRDGAFTRLTKEDGLPGESIREIRSDADGALWFGTDGGLCRLRDGVATTFGEAQGLPVRIVAHQAFDEQGRLWVGTVRGLARLENGRFVTLTTEDGLPANEISPVCSDGNGGIWAGTSRGLCSISAAGIKTYGVRDGLAGEKVETLYLDSQGTLWIGTSQGLSRLRNGRFESLTVQGGLPSNTVMSIFEDREGSIWVGTNGGGLFRLRDVKVVALTIRHGLSMDNVRVVCQARDGAIWIGTNGGGLNRLKDGQVSVFTHKQGLPDDAIRALCEDREGTLWVGTQAGGLCRFKDGTFTTLTAKDGFSSTSIRAIVEDGDGSIWVGTQYDGIVRIDGSTVTPVKQLGAPRSSQICALHVDREGALWVGALGADLIRFKDGQWRTFTFENLQKSLGVLAIYEDVDGNLWFGTSGNGLGLLRNGAIRVFTRQDGLFDDVAFQILEDEHGTMWMSSNKGIYSVRRQDLLDLADGRIPSVQCTAFGKADGMRSNQCNGASQPAGWRASDGRLWFPTLRGVAIIDPNHQWANRLMPPVCISQVVVDGTRIGLGQGQSFAWSSEKFEFHYDGLSLVVPGRVRFRYRLEGLETDWVEAGTRRVAFYNTLPAGEYRFRVLACNNDGVWNETGASFGFRVPPPFWRSWWAYLLYVGAGAGLVLGGMRLRLRTLQRRHEELEALVAERTAALAESEREALEASRAKSVFLSSMSHELRTPLNAVIGFAQLMDRGGNLSTSQRQYLEIIHSSGQHLLGLINDVLSISKIEAGRTTLTLTCFDLASLLRSVEEMVRVRAEARGLELVAEIDPDLPHDVCGDEGKLRQVLFNLLGNAVKFTDRGSVTLRARWSGESDASGLACFEVEDTGYGISEADLGKLFQPFVQTESGQRAQEGTGLGLMLSRQMVQLMGGDIRVRSRLGEGTVFSFEVALVPGEGEGGAAPARRVKGLVPGQRRPKVLVVDDVVQNRLLLSKLLESTEFEVRQATNGREAVTEWERWSPELIFMDMRMPVMDGYEATRRIRSQAATGSPSEAYAASEERDVAARSPVIIALSASAFEHEREEILAAGCDDFIAKPFAEQILFDKLAAHLGVQFLFEGAEPDEAATQTTLSMQRLAALSPEVLLALHEALARGNVKTALLAVETVRPFDESLATELHQAIKGFHIDALLSLIEELWERPEGASRS